LNRVLERKDGGLFLFVFIPFVLDDEDDDEEEENLSPASTLRAIVQAISNPKYDARDCSHF